MFCPNCAAKNSVEQKFCRSCGMNLEETAASLSGQYGSDFEKSVAGWEKVFNTIGKIGFGGFCALVFAGIIGLIYVIIDSMILSGRQPIVGSFIATFIIFAALTLAWVVFNETQKEKKEKRITAPLSPPDTPELEPANTNRLTDGAHIPTPASVTENTTNLLPAQKKTGES